MRKLKIKMRKPMGPRPDFKDHALNIEMDAEEGAQNLHTMVWVCLLRGCSRPARMQRQVFSGARQGTSMRNVGWGGVW